MGQPCLAEVMESRLGPGGSCGSWPLITGDQTATFMERKVARIVTVLGLFDETQSHLPGCCFYYGLVSGTELTEALLSTSSVFEILPVRGSSLGTNVMIPNGSL